MKKTSLKWLFAILISFLIFGEGMNVSAADGTISQIGDGWGPIRVSTIKPVESDKVKIVSESTKKTYKYYHYHNYYSNTDRVIDSKKDEGYWDYCEFSTDTELTDRKNFSDRGGKTYIKVGDSCKNNIRYWFEDVTEIKEYYYQEYIGTNNATDYSDDGSWGDVKETFSKPIESSNLRIVKTEKIKKYKYYHNHNYYSNTNKVLDSIPDEGFWDYCEFITDSALATAMNFSDRGGKTYVKIGSPCKHGFTYWFEDITESVKYYYQERKVSAIKTKKSTIELYNIADAKSTDFRYSAVFDESYFNSGNSQEVAKKGLMKLSALGAISTYSKKDKNEKDSDIVKKTNATAFLKACGFNNVKKMFSATGDSSGNSTKKDNDNGIIYCGWQDLNDNSRLFGVIVSGYSSGNYEWVSNFKLGEGNVHSGFEIAATKLTVLLAKYINGHSDNKKIKVWIMGHSRGGALTNLIAVELVGNQNIEGTKNIYKEAIRISKDDIYAYGFATPQYTKKRASEFDKCIINVISPDDFVPCVAPKKWGFMRLGTDIPIKNKSKMEELFKIYTGGKYKGYTESERKDIVKKFENYGKGQAEYVYAGAQDYCMNGIGMSMAKHYITGVVKTIKNPRAISLTTSLFRDYTLDKINHSHSMITYLAWIDANY